MLSTPKVPKMSLTAQLVKRKVRSLQSPMKLNTKEPALDATPDQKPLLKSVFSGYR